MVTNNEKWLRWEPMAELTAKQYDLGSIIDNITTFELNFFNQEKEDQIVVFSFGSCVDAYRCTLRALREKAILDLDKKHGIKLCKDWTFFIVHNSEYLHWLVEESDTIFDPSDYTHFAFITRDFVIDIVSLDKPQIKVIKG